MIRVIQAHTGDTTKKRSTALGWKIDVKTTSKGKVGSQNMYWTQLQGSNDVTGVMMHNKAIPVGKKSKKGAQIEASFESLKKFWTTKDSPRLFTASKKSATKSFMAVPNVIVSELSAKVMIAMIRHVTITQMER